MNILIWLSIGLDRRSPSEHLLRDIVETLCKKGHKVHILQKNTFGDKKDLNRRFEELGVTITYVDIKLPNKSNLIARYLSDLLYIKKCSKWLRENKKIDRVFVQSSNVAGIQVRKLKSFLKNVPIILNIQDIFPQNALYSGKISKGNLIYKLLLKKQTYAYNNVNHIITISEDMKNELVASRVNSNKITVVYNWSYQDNVLNPKTTISSEVSNLFDKNKFNVVYAGNVGLMQNVSIIIRAAKILKKYDDICFYIVGNGIYKNKLIDIVKNEDLNNVKFYDMMDSKYAPSIYCAADINIIPLLKDIYKTALPSKTATCLACQQPIIFCFGKSSSFGKNVSLKTGCPCIECDDAEDLSKQILKIKNNELKCYTKKFYLENFKKSINSTKYANIIENPDNFKI